MNETSESTASRSTLVRDDVAYMAPMFTFLGFIWIAGKFPDHYAIIYAIKTVVVAAMLFAFRKQYTPIKWNFWWLGIIVGILGIVQWVGMQLWLQNHFEFFKPSADVFDPTKAFSSAGMMGSFIAVRIIGACLVVPIMEELFWRDFLWRSILAPADFKLAKVGEWGLYPFLIVAGAFATVHGNWWLTAIPWALMVGVLLLYTKSLGACIVAHATTNLLLALYVLKTHDWAFW